MNHNYSHSSNKKMDVTFPSPVLYVDIAETLLNKHSLKFHRLKKIMFIGKFLLHCTVLAHELLKCNL